MKALPSPRRMKTARHGFFVGNSHAIVPQRGRECTSGAAQREPGGCAPGPVSERWAGAARGHGLAGAAAGRAGGQATWLASGRGTEGAQIPCAF
jgi:hypothetical protein